MPLTQKDLDVLKARRVALVYAFPKPDDPENRWYDRWRTRVIMSYGEALERIGIIPYYCDIDTFLGQAVSGKLDFCDAVMSLNAGVRPVSHFAVVPAVAYWFQKPIIPCTADTIIAGERKDLGNAIAQSAGLKVPKIYRRNEISIARESQRLLIKPRDLGGSYGLKVIDGCSLEASDFDVAKIVQEFIPGYDVTISVFIDSKSKNLIIGDATVYIPTHPSPLNWIYDRQAKEDYVGGAGVSGVNRRQLPLHKDASKAIRGFCKMIGVDCFARVDFRLEATQLENYKSIYIDDLAFIEINPMPTVCVGLAFVESVRSFLLEASIDKEQPLGIGLNINDDYDVIAYVLGQSLLSQLGPAKMNDRNQIGS